MKTIGLTKVLCFLLFPISLCLFLLILMPCVCHGLCVFHLQQCWSVPKLFGSFVFVIFLSFMTDRQCPKKLHQTDFDSHMLLMLSFTLISLICSVSFWRYSAAIIKKRQILSFEFVKTLLEAYGHQDIWSSEGLLHLLPIRSILVVQNRDSDC